MVLLPQPGMPMSTMLVLSRRRSARMRWFSLSGMAFSKKCSSAALAWATSMGRPSVQGMPSASACSSRAVRRGLYTTSATPRQAGKAARFTGAAPLPGNIPTGVVFTTMSASAWRERFS